MQGSATQASRMGASTIQNQSAVGNVEDVSALVKSVKADIAHLKAQLESIPPFPEGKSTGAILRTCRFVSYEVN